MADQREPDTENPAFILSSAETSHSADYRLTGAALDNVGVVTASYSHAGAAPVELDLNSMGLFSAELSLNPGANVINLSASDLAGNSATEEFTVTYLPPIADVQITPMAAPPGQTVAITGTGFGDALGHVTFGRQHASVESWTDTKLTVTVPQNATGWHDVRIRRPNSEYTVQDFFAGIEVADSAELQAELAHIQPGTALLLSGSTYALSGQDFTTPFSIFGSRTDSEPGTTLELTSPAIFRVSPFGMIIRDLQLEIGTVRFLHSDNPVPPPTADVPDGLVMENVDIIPLDPDDTGATFTTGDYSQQTRSPAAVHLEDVHMSGLNGAIIAANTVRIEDSTIITLQHVLAAATAPESALTILDSTLRSGTSPGTGQLQLETPGPALLKRSTFDAGTVSINSNSTGSIIRFNSVTAANLTVGAPGELLFDNNDVELTGSLSVYARNITLSNNSITTPGGIQFRGSGDITVSGNHLFLTGIAPQTHALYFRPNAGSLNVEFSGNTTNGGNRLFHFQQVGSTYSLEATISGNTFNADLQAPGAVARLDNMTAAGAVQSSDNIWGALTSAAEVYALIEYANGSVSDAMIITEF